MRVWSICEGVEYMRGCGVYVRVWSICEGVEYM